MSQYQNWVSQNFYDNYYNSICQVLVLHLYKVASCKIRFFVLAWLDSRDSFLPELLNVISVLLYVLVFPSWSMTPILLLLRKERMGLSDVEIFIVSHVKLYKMSNCVIFTFKICFHCLRLFLDCFCHRFFTCYKKAIKGF